MNVHEKKVDLKQQKSVVYLLAGLAALGTLSTNIILPSFPSISADLNVPSIRLSLTLSVFFLVFAGGQLLVGPLSDRIGRSIPVVVGLVVFVIGSLICSMAQDFNMLLAGRVVQAIGVCAASVLSRAIARDLFEGPSLMRAMSFMMIASAAAPGFSPLFGAMLERTLGWPATFIFTAVCGAVIGGIYLFTIGETHVPQVCASKRKQGAFLSYVSVGTSKTFLGPTLASAFIMGGLFGFFSAAPSILLGQMGLSTLGIGWFFAATVFIVFAAGAVASRLVKQSSSTLVSVVGLIIAIFGGSGLILSALLSDENLIYFTLATAVFLFGMGLSLPLCTAQALIPFAHLAGAASSLLGFFQMMGAAIATGLIAILSTTPSVSLGLVQAVGCLLGLISLLFSLSSTNKKQTSKSIGYSSSVSI
tara:strand:- start:11111 stop:12364 length:1254 start_codon:yes stop_codon:yes gene_type:complete